MVQGAFRAERGSREWQVICLQLLDCELSHKVEPRGDYCCYL